MNMGRVYWCWKLMMTLLRSWRTRQSWGAWNLKWGQRKGPVVSEAAPLHRTVWSSVCQNIPEKLVAHEGWRCYQSSRRTLRRWSKSVFANCCSIPLGLCNCTAPCAFWLQQKNQCEDCIHPSKGPVMCESQWARARPACDYLLFQLFPRLTLWVGEKVVCMCICVCWFGGGGVGALKWDGEILSSIKKDSEVERATIKCTRLCVYNLSESVSYIYYAVVCLYSGNTLDNPGTSYNICSFSLAHTHREEDEVLCAHAPTQTRPYAWLPLI